MNTLHIYPTSRALRSISKTQRLENGFQPTLMRMDAFEQRSIILENKSAIDPLQRILFLRRATKFKGFENLKFDSALFRFFTRSEALFKFFEELSSENVSFSTLAEADAYVEFSKHLEILEKLLKNYATLLDEAGLIDKAFVPHNYTINKGFLENYEAIEIHIEGYLSHFELSLLEEVSQIVPLVLHYSTSQFTLKMQERFGLLGIELQDNYSHRFSLSDKVILESRENTATIQAQVYAVEERIEQVAIAFAKIENMVNSGIDAEDIVLVLPDESFKEYFMLFDVHNNLNFAMGYDYSNGRIYKVLDALYHYWQGFDKDSHILLERYGFNIEALEKISNTKKQKVEDFFIVIGNLGLHENTVSEDNKNAKINTRIYEKYIHFSSILAQESMRQKDWLFLWLKTLSKFTLDDVRGGKITVMGVLETRGVQFKGVVIVDFNEGIVPTSSSKDQFLNASVRAFAKLPTKQDRESLQKQYYKRLLEEAEQSVILYSTSDNTLPSKFLYELNLNKAQASKAQFSLLYSQASQLQKSSDPLVENFDATAITWSASRLKVYLECKRKYYYRYIQKLSGKQDETLNEGAFLHHLFDHLFRENNAFNKKEEMHKKIDALLNILLPYEDTKTEYQKLLWKAKLKGFVRSQIEHFNLGWKVLKREEEFQATIFGLKFKGRIDRIDQNETQTLIIDYKSGSLAEAQKSKNLETLSDFQMSIYEQMLKSKYPNLKLCFLKIFDEGKLEEITALESKNTLLEKYIIELKETSTFVAKKCESLAKCKFCEFTLMCERGEYL